MEEIQSRLRNWASISAQALGYEPEQDAEELTDFEPLQFNQKIVLRHHGQIPTDLLVMLHNLYKEDASGANEVLSEILHGDFELPENVSKYTAFRAFFEE